VFDPSSTNARLERTLGCRPQAPGCPWRRLETPDSWRVVTGVLPCSRRCFVIYHKFCIKKSTDGERSRTCRSQNSHVGNPGVVQTFEFRAHPRSLCHRGRPSPWRRGGCSFGHRRLFVPASRPAHPDVSINHRVDAVPLLFLRFHARMVPAAVTREKWHFCPIHREFRAITLSCQGEARVRTPRSRCVLGGIRCNETARLAGFMRKRSRTLTSKLCSRLLHN
jgi:hypothetical protein